MSEVSRIRWLCRRGMKELDVLLERFREVELAGLDAGELTAFRALLEREDPDLYAVLVSGEAPADPAQAKLAARIRTHRRAV